MKHEITADWETLILQADTTAIQYYKGAQMFLEDQLERQFIKSYLTADIIALASIMAQDFHSSSVGIAAQKISEVLQVCCNEITNLKLERTFERI